MSYSTFSDLVNKQSGDPDQDAMNKALIDSLGNQGTQGVTGPAGASTAPVGIPQPNGGLDGQALQDYIKANPGPVATIGINTNVSGPAPSPTPQKDDSDDDSEDEDDSPAKKLADLKSKKAKLFSKPDSQQAPTAPGISDLLSKLAYKPDTSDLQAAQQAANQSNLIANMGKATNQIGAAIGRTSANNEVFNDIAKNANAPIDQLNARDAYVQQKEKTDPNSEVSKMYRDVGKKWGFNIPDTASASQLEKVSPMFEKYAATKESAESRKQVAQQNFELKKMMAGDKQDQHNKDKQGQAVKSTLQMLESARGNPEVSNALRNKGLIQNAMSIINKYPDPNKLSNQDVAMLVTEQGKIASGGVPAEHDLQMMMPNTVRAKLAKKWSELTNNPTPANAGSFIKDYKHYMLDLDENATNTINTKVNRIVNSNSDLNDDNRQNVKENYIRKSLKEINPTDQYSDKEPAIQSFMQANGIKDRDQAIKILKDNGRL